MAMMAWMQLCCQSGIAKTARMSGSYQRLRRPERRLVQVASGVAEQRRLIVADDGQVRGQAGFGEVAYGRGLAVAGDRGFREGGPQPPVSYLGPVPSWPGLGG